MEWENEEWKCLELRARVVDVPPTGESEPMLLMDVIDRKVWVPVSGIYILRSGDDVQYVGMTAQPLGVRLRAAISSGKTWTCADYRTWTVTMQRAPEFPLDKRREWALIQELKPPFNVVGRKRTRPRLS